MMNYKLKRWAKRDACIVEWGNVVGPYIGQEFRETFATEEEAKIREQQALACEAIPADREPIPFKIEVLH
jgi:hypothetical protein